MFNSASTVLHVQTDKQARAQNTVKYFSSFMNAIHKTVDKSPKTSIIKGSVLNISTVLHTQTDKGARAQTTIKFFIRIFMITIHKMVNESLRLP